MPTDDFDATRTTEEGYASPFRKSTESASPGYYAVTLDRGDIRTEITATTRAAHHRWNFDDDEGWVVVDLAHHLSGGEVTDAEIHLDPVARTIRGRLRSVGALSDSFGGADIHFAARTNVAWTASQVWSDGAPAPGTDAAGTGAGAALSFETGNAPIEMQVGVSFVSGNAALANLDAELPAWDFDGTRAATDAAWEALLSRVVVNGGTRDERHTFYTSSIARS